MITSRSNPQVKHVRRLIAERRRRYQMQMFVVEGTRWMRELVASAVTPQVVYCTIPWREAQGNAALLAELGVEPVLVDEQVMTGMGDTDAAPGVLAIVPMPSQTLPEEPTFFLILDGIANPGNLGTILRTAAAARVDGVLLTPGSVDPFNPKVIRGSMGAVLRLPVQQMTWDEIVEATQSMTVWLAAAADGVPYGDVDWRGPSALIIGSEAHGAGSEAAALANGRVTIPLDDHTESLNAAVAAGILVFEAVEQRRESGA